MKVVHLVPSFSRSYGGPFVSISRLIRGSIEQGIEATVMGPRGSESEEELAAWKPAKIYRHRTVGPHTLGYRPALLPALRGTAPLLLHAHGIWTYDSIAAFLWSRRTGKPFVVSVHGMLEPWALQQSPVKKRMARRIYQDKALRGAACLRATSSMEIESIRNAGFSNPVALIPNALDLPSHPVSELRSPNRKIRQALFLSRLHPKKGLLNLVAAWGHVRPADWELLIVGPDQDGYRAEVETAIKNADLDKCVTVVGPVWGDHKFRQYWQADLFVLPSFSENFGMSVAEALACEVPVITTTALPWAEIAQRRCGWQVDIGVEPLTNVLREAVALSDEDRREMGRRGRELIAEKYTWESVGKKIAKLYEWLLSGGNPPPIVKLT